VRIFLSVVNFLEVSSFFSPVATLFLFSGFNALVVARIIHRPCRRYKSLLRIAFTP